MRPGRAGRHRRDRRARQRSYRADGFVTVRGFLALAEVADLVAAIEAAPDPDEDANPLSVGSMRFASNLFRGSPALQRFLSSPAVVDLVGDLLGPDAWVRWDQAVWKDPGAPEFPLHQDNGYTGLDAEHLQIWVALSPMTRRNGGLEVVPGGHRSHLAHRWLGSHATTDDLGPRRPIDAEPGDLVAFSSLLPHATTPNTSDQSRLAYVAELLPLGVEDPTVDGPPFVACRGGRPVGVFATTGTDAHDR